jgi:hypothetical protein
MIVRNRIGFKPRQRAACKFVESSCLLMIGQSAWASERRVIAAFVEWLPLLDTQSAQELTPWGPCCA